jgi:hypothetical protein
MSKAPRVGGFRIYDGPSTYNGSRVIAYVANPTKPSSNRKTGDMAQVYIFLAERSPLEAVQDGSDEATCGDCSLRKATAKPGAPTCYVTTLFLKAAWLAALKSPLISPEEAITRVGIKPLRNGAYGDPAAVPADIWRRLGLGSRKRGTSYTHGWGRDGFDTSILEFSMASIDAHNAKDRHKLPEWARTYRVIAEGDVLEAGEILCPHTTTGAQCVDCGLCGGSNVKAKNIAVLAI